MCGAFLMIEIESWAIERKCNGAIDVMIPRRKRLPGRSETCSRVIKGVSTENESPDIASIGLDFIWEFRYLFTC